jgi:hypothetical protein
MEQQSPNSPQVDYTGDELLLNKNTEDDIDYFQENLQNEYQTLPDFLDFHSSFPKSGKQGILGLLSNTENGRKYVYKISQYLNFVVEQEHTVMEGLNGLRDFCPHFCKTLGRFKTNVSDSYRNTDNPFDIEKDSVLTSVLLMENIEGGRKLYRYIKNNSITPEICMSIVKQVLIADIIAGELTKFSHYDLHSNNVLVKKCPVNSVFFYILDENRTYLVPTYGYYPIIIDFGFSYNKNCDSKPLYGALAHTDIGFMPSVYDQHSDPKLFLTSVSNEMKKYKKSDVSNNFRDLITNIYKNCNVDLECGWDDREGTSISDSLLKRMSGQFKRSKFFKNQGHHIVDILQTLVDLPLTHRNTKDNIDDLAGILVTEFYKIEREIGNDFYNMYILKNIVENCVKYRMSYLNKDTRDAAVLSFRQDTLKVIDSLVNFCNPKVNWEKLLCCLLCLSKCIENLCYEKLKKLMSTKKSDYNKMLLKNTSEIYEAIEANIPSHFFFDENTVVYVWNCVEQRSYKIKLGAQKIVDELNDTHPFERGMLLYEYLTTKNY